MSKLIQTSFLLAYTSMIGLRFGAIIFLPPVDALDGIGEEQAQQEVTIEPHALLQTEIDRLIKIIKEEPVDEALAVHQLDILKVIGGERYELLVPQLVYYSMRGEDVAEAMAFDIVVGHLKIPKYYIADALRPYLGTTKPQLKQQLREALEVVEATSSGRPPDYSHYGAIIEASVREGKELPRSLIHYMYESDPGTAVIRVMRSSMLRKPNEVKPILWAEHQVADVLWKWRHGFLDCPEVEPVATEALAKLVAHPRWWARLYVAEIMRQHPAFRTDELIAVLLADPDESVRSVVTSFVTNNAQDD